MKNIELWDENQNHICGTLYDDNHIELSSNNRDFIRGELHDNHIELADKSTLHL